MPVPSNISELSTTPGSNFPLGSENPATFDDYVRTHAAFIAQLRDGKAATTDAVMLTGAQTVAGVKTFSSSPVVPDASFGISKIANIATARVLGRVASGSGAVQELTAADVLSILGVGSGGFAQVGDVKHVVATTAPIGWIAANGGTIGSASSGGTMWANALAEPLFTHLWTNCTQAVLPIQTSAGGASTRGASAAADFAANKRMPLPDLRAEFIRGLDDGRGVDSSRALGSTQSFQLSQHTHTIPVTLNSAVGAFGTPTSASGAPDFNATSGASGSTTNGNETRPRNVALLAVIKY